MAQREGSVYLYLFIAVLVLFAGAVVMFITTNAEKEKLIAANNKHELEVEKFKARAQELEQEKSKIWALIMGPDYETAAPPELESVFNDELKLKAEKAINETLKELGENPRDYQYLVEPYPDIGRLLTAYSTRMNVAETEKNATKAAQVQMQQSAMQTAETMRERTQELSTRIEELERRYEDLDNTYKTEKSQWVRDMEAKADECADQITERDRKIIALTNRINYLDRRLEKLREEVIKETTFDEVEPDGQILAVFAGSGKAWINLGRQDHLRNNLVFRVFQEQKGGRRLYKGRVEVRKVNEENSEVRILEEVDNLNPITQRDWISSPFYDPKKSPVFVFGGRELQSEDITLEQLEARIRSYGGRISDKVDLDTDFLVALNKYETSPEYTAARELSVTVIRERDLLEFVGW